MYVGDGRKKNKIEERRVRMWVIAIERKRGGWRDGRERSNSKAGQDRIG